jgi:DNA polymerase (family 10)
MGQVLARGPTKSSIVLRSGLQVDLRRVAQESFGAALQYFTGSQAHNIAIRRIGRQHGLKINEYGVFDSDGKVAGETEESVYRALGLPWFPPELREDQDEIEAAREGRLPELVELADIKGELHSHTKATDGRNSLAEMAQGAKRCGLHYLAVTDHSQFLRMVDGLDERHLLAQIEEIDRLNAKVKGIRLLKGIEVEILTEHAAAQRAIKAVEADDGVNQPQGVELPASSFELYCFFRGGMAATRFLSSS